MSELEEQKKKEISELCKMSLISKWYRTSKIELSDKCSFCCDADKKKEIYDIDNNIDVCDICLCPSEICKSYGKTGYIAKLFLNHKYDKFDTTISDLTDEEFNKMESLFKKYIF